MKQVNITYKNGEKLANQVNEKLRQDSRFNEFRTHFDPLDGLYISLKDSMVFMYQVDNLGDILRPLGLRVLAIGHPTDNMTCLYLTGLE